jgi:alkylation response protein AidB-like acyl-CoA dehydrogenase
VSPAPYVRDLRLPAQGSVFGRGATLIHQFIYQQELERVKAPPTVNFQGIARVGPTLMQWGTPEQKKRYIPTARPGAS